MPYSTPTFSVEERERESERESERERESQRERERERERESDVKYEYNCFTGVCTSTVYRNHFRVVRYSCFCLIFF